jgi:hypothetical protein
MALKTTAQAYPRIPDETDDYYGFLDVSQLQEHSHVISEEEIKQIIKRAIINANKKSSRSILAIPNDVSRDELLEILRKQGKKLFQYFIKYCGDPASTAHDCYKQHYSKIAKEQFRNRTLQKERMNSGWRYQFIAKDAAVASKRFFCISDIGATEADFTANISIKGNTNDLLNIYVSVKNRTNTMGGQDWPKAIQAIENMAKNDKNKTGPYICVFGIAMEKGTRTIRNEQKSGTPYSVNTEIWLSDFFWPFFSNFSYEQIIKCVLDVLIEQNNTVIDFEIPNELIDSFGDECRKLFLLDENGNFSDPYNLVNLFCGKLK